MAVQVNLVLNAYATLWVVFFLVLCERWDTKRAARTRLSQSLGRLFRTLQSIAMGRGTVLDYVSPEAQAVADDLNELDNEEYEL